MNQPVLEVTDLKKYFPISDSVFQNKFGQVRAVDGISFSIHRGEVFGLIGESGSGKTTVGRTLLRLIEKTAGRVLFHGLDVHSLDTKALRQLRPKMQYIFQDPYSSLNPRMRIGDAIGEPLLQHGYAAKRELRDKVNYILELCGLAPYHFDRFPHEFSGGQRQRIVIARAMALEPEFVVADEPVSALDVSVQAQIINLFSDLQETRQISFLFISHDLSVVEHLCTRIAIMYLGKIVEVAQRDSLFAYPGHPYTRALLSAVPVPDPTLKRSKIILRGEIPSPTQPPSGCGFHTRCPYVQKHCRETMPELRELKAGHWVACHNVPNWA
jgi:peptide/nickel transport system ATP-binding protein